MGVENARQDRPAPHVDLRGGGVDLDVAGPPDLDDSFSSDHDHRVGERGSARPVDQCATGQHEHLRLGRLQVSAGAPLDRLRSGHRQRHRPYGKGSRKDGRPPRGVTHKVLP